jgi:hypothetical protein
VGGGGWIEWLVIVMIPKLLARVEYIIWSESVKEEKVIRDRNHTTGILRVYLGSSQGKIGGKLFSIRDFKLYLNHITDLGLDTEALACRIGSILAILYWGAKTDVRDVEFVLGSSTKTITAKSIPTKDLKPCTYTGPPTDEIEDFFYRVTELFVLHFNQVRRITIDDDGVVIAVEVWRLNDPYYPKPFRQTAAERHPWKAFVISYLAVSQEVIN